jgi:hypothetical protein
MAKTSRQIAAARRNIAIARSKRRRRSYTKAVAAKKNYNRKHQAKFAKRRVRRIGTQYKKTGLISPGRSRTNIGMVRRYKKASKFNVKHGKRTKRYDKRIARAKKRR